jgi:transcriptional regulator with XRE-family HTH domain
MSERSNLINKLRTNWDSRAAYIRAKLDVLIPSQLRALRLRQPMTQAVLADEAGMKQSRISAMETPGKTNFNLETLVSLAATFRVGLVVKFVPFSGMLRWENEFSQDAFTVTRIDDDIQFLHPGAKHFDVGEVIVMGGPKIGAIGQVGNDIENDSYRIAAAGVYAASNASGTGTNSMQLI